MRRTPINLLGAAVVLATLAACGGSSGGSTPTGGSSEGGEVGGGQVMHPKALVGTVGENDAFAIEVTDQDDNDVENIAAGTYKLTIHDDSAMHNFHLTGPGVDVSTEIADVTTKTVTVKLQPGEYTYQCDPHASQMHGTITVS